jgi:hypothetical protein
MNMKAYWDKVKEVEKGLPDNVMLISVETAQHKAGSVVAVARRTAARRIVERTHRVATDEEVLADKQKTEQKLEYDRQRELRRQPVTRLVPVAQEFGPAVAHQQIQGRGKTGAV